MLLEKKIAIVTGAAQGLGEGIARLFASEGADVALCDLNEEGAGEVASQIARQTGRRAIAYGLDVSKKTQVVAVVGAIAAELGRIDVLVNAAGVIKPVPFLEEDEDNLDWHFNVNFRGPYLMSQAVARIMYQRGGCKIVNISSDSAVAAFPNETAYGSSKAALVALTRVIAKDLGVYGIYCNAICPGAILTPMLKTNFLTSPGKEEEYAAATALKRIAKPEDIARVALFFACHLSDHVTGEHIMATAGDIMSQ
jgi:NAD(P)-dependent dehydrogenase (short-subunit alcohol dehydrogenase family)